MNITLFYVGEGERHGYTVYFYDIKNDGVTVGECELREGNTEQSGNVGYRIDEEYRKKGYATESLKQLKAEAKEKGIDGLVILCDAENIASRRVAEKAGAKFVSETETPENSALYAYGKRKIIKYIM